MTMLEMIFVIALMAVLIAIALGGSLASLQRGRAQSAIHEIQSMAQLARMEAVSRNRECVLLLSPDTRQVIAADGQDTPSTTDDLILREARLPSSVAFARPDSGSSISWESLGGSPAWYRLRFASDGTVAAGDGDIFLKGDEHYERLSVFISGGTRISTWKEGGWQQGG